MIDRPSDLSRLTEDPDVEHERLLKLLAEERAAAARYARELADLRIQFDYLSREVEYLRAEREPPP